MSTSTAIVPLEDTSTDKIIGYIALVISCAAFGTMFVPLRRADCRDGFFVQWVECSVVVVVGFVINAIRGFPQFEWIAAIGGLLYATGNVFSVPIVGGIGMGLGLLIWGSMQIMVGWSVARFGLFGWLSPSHVEYDYMNYIGLALTILSGVLFVFVRHNEEEVDEEERNSYELKSAESASDETDTSTNMAELVKKIPYIVMAMVLAVFHGLMMSPIDILKQKHPSTDKYKVFDYCWSFYSTVFVFSTFYFFLYALIYRRRVHVEKELLLPSFLYGCLWTAGMTFWFVSSDKLSQVVAYPITTRLPAILSALIEVFIFKTISGRKNIIYLSFVILVGLTGVVMIALSNQKL